MPTTTTTHLSHGTKSVLRSRRYQPSIEVSATVKASVAVANRELAVLPQHPGADPDERGDGRCEGDRVVGVEDAGHEAEGQPGDEQPRAEDRDRGEHVRPTPREPQGGSTEHQRGREQPGDLAADLAVEQAQDAGRAPAASALATAAADGAGLVAAEPAQAVVAEGELEDGVVLRAADPGAARGRPELDDRRSTSRRRAASSRRRRAGGRAACPRRSGRRAGRPGRAPAGPGRPASSW